MGFSVFLLAFTKPCWGIEGIGHSLPWLETAHPCGLEGLVKVSGFGIFSSNPRWYSSFSGRATASDKLALCQFRRFSKGISGDLAFTKPRCGIEGIGRYLLRLETAHPCGLEGLVKVSGFGIFSSNPYQTPLV